MKAALHNLGCKVNAYETEAMQQILEEAGYEIVPFSEYADVYVINTCSVTNMADRKSRQMLHRAKKQNPDAIVVGAGCYVQTKEAQALVDESIDIVIGNNKKHELVPLLREYEASHRKMACVADINHEKQAYEELSLSRTAEHTRAFIKVQDGCNQFCTYCIIPFARGRVRSRELPDVLQEIRTLAKSGYREVVLSAISLPSYGLDTGTNLVELVEHCAQVEGIQRIRLGSLDPDMLTPEFITRLAAVEKLCPQFHLSLQSGSDGVLRRMHRHYDTARYLQSVRLLQQWFPGCAVTTDLIVGFPGETEEEFEDTLSLIEEVRYDALFTFIFSPRAGTPAAKMDDPTPKEEKNRRFDRLCDVQNRISLEIHQGYVGKTVRVLCDGRDKDMLTARTEGGRLVRFAGDDSLIGQFFDVTITGCTTWSLVGELR